MNQTKTSAWRAPTEDDIGKQMEIFDDRFRHPELNPGGVMVAMIERHEQTGNIVARTTRDDGIMTSNLPFLVRE